MAETYDDTGATVPEDILNHRTINMQEAEYYRFMEAIACSSEDRALPVKVESCEPLENAFFEEFAGVRRGKEHTLMDQYCADRGAFVIENLCNLGAVAAEGALFTAHTYPMNYAEMTGLPCRVVAEII